MKYLLRTAVFPGKFRVAKGSPLRARKFPYATSVVRVAPEDDCFDVYEEPEIGTMSYLVDTEKTLDAIQKAILKLTALYAEQTEK